MAIIIFDLDGTLIDSAPDIHVAATLTLQEEGQEPLDLATIRSFIGNGIPMLIERIMLRVFGIIEPRRHDLLERRFMEHYNAAPTTLTRVYPGVKGALTRLVQMGHQLALCTNKPEKTSRAILNGLGIGDEFAVVIGGDTLAERKPDPAPLHAAVTALGNSSVVVYVGDSEIDEEAALAADIPFLLFTEGYRKKTIEEMHFAVSFSDFGCLPDLVTAQVEGVPEARPDA